MSNNSLVQRTITRRDFLLSLAAVGLGGGAILASLNSPGKVAEDAKADLANPLNNPHQLVVAPATMREMKLTKVDIPTPKALRGGWAALSAVHLVAEGWTDNAMATSSQWLYDDGGGNWACLRFKGKDQAILFGNDHELSETYFHGDYNDAQYIDLGVEKTDLLAGAPDWWNFDLSSPVGDSWIGFIYGWDGSVWQRAAYDKEDGFRSLRLLEAIAADEIQEFAFESTAPEFDETIGMDGIVNADGAIKASELSELFPGCDAEKGAAAARRFLEAPV